MRVIGEEQVVGESDRLVANTDIEASELIKLYDADASKVAVVPPGVDLDRFTPGDRAQARHVFGIPQDAIVLAFVGRIQPLKAPDVLLRAAAEMLVRDPGLRSRLVVLIVGGPSGSGTERPKALEELAVQLGITDVVRFLPPQPGPALAEVYRAADLVAVPSHNESFGLVALEAQACGTPVVAAAVGGLPVAVDDGVSGVLVQGHEPDAWAAAIGSVALPRREHLAGNAVAHARRFSWDRTTDALLAGYQEAADAFRREVFI
jgi:D-inositol-3-phosphate glycosyltransferase